MPPILTGEHPPSGSAGINAPVCAIVKWQPLYSATNNGGRAARVRLWNAAHARSPSRFNIFKWETRQLAPFERRT